MKKLKLSLIIFIVSIFVGCSNNTQQYSQDTTDELMTWLPFNIGVTRYFETDNLGIGYDTLVKIEKFSEDHQVHYYFEGEQYEAVRDFKDTGYIKNIIVSENAITEIKNGQESVLLKFPLEQARQWPTNYWLKDIGWVSGVTQIESIEENRIILVFKSESDHLIWHYTLEKGQGIVKSLVRYNGFKQQRNLSSIKATPPKEFVSRYVLPSDTIAPYFKNDLFVYNKKFTNYKNTLNRMSSDRIANYYRQSLYQLEIRDIRNINQSLNYAKYAILKGGDENAIMIDFVMYYQKVLNYQNNHIDKLINHDQLHSLYRYNNAKGYYIFNKKPKKNKETQIIGSILEENGVGIHYVKGMAQFYPMPNYLTEHFRTILSDKTLIKLVEKDFRLFAYLSYDDRIDWFAMADHMADLEIYLNTNQQNNVNHYLQARLKLFKMHYLSPQAFSEYSLNHKFIEGICLTDIKSSYEKTISQYGSAGFCKDVKAIYQSLKKYNFIWTSHYEDTLKEIGIDIVAGNLPYGYNPLAETQSKMYHKVDQLDLQVLPKPIYDVSSSEELLMAIGSNRTIRLTGHIYTIQDEMTTDNVRFDLGRLVLHDIENLTIITNHSATLSHLITREHGTIIKFINCKDITIKNVRFNRHSEDKVTPLVMIEHSQRINFLNCVWSGPASTGFEVRYSKNLKFKNNIINYIFGPIANFEKTNDVLIKGMNALQLGQDMLYLKSTLKVHLENSTIQKSLSVYKTSPVPFTLINATLKIVNCQFNETSFDEKTYHTTGLSIED